MPEQHLCYPWPQSYLPKYQIQIRDDGCIAGIYPGMSEGGELTASFFSIELAILGKLKSRFLMFV